MYRLDGKSKCRWALEDDAELRRQCGSSGVVCRDLHVPGHTTHGSKQRMYQLGLRCVKKAPTSLPGQSMRAPKAVEHPTLKGIYWAAGFFDGEGSSALAVDKRSRGSNGSTIASVSQKDPELLHKMRRLFGGSVGPRKVRSVIRGKHYTGTSYAWQISGPRARGFLMTIYSLLSARRREQIRRTLQVAA